MQEFKNFSLENDHIVQATAGAGKTTKLVEDVYLVYKNHFQKFGVKPKILLTTFTVKAANELAERIMLSAQNRKDSDFLAYSVSYLLEIGTMHSVFSGLMNKIDSDTSMNHLNFVSSSYKSLISDHYITKSIEKYDLIESFNDRHLFKECMDLFATLDRENIKFDSLYTYNELLEAVKTHLSLQFSKLNIDIDLGSIVNFSDLEIVAGKISEYFLDKKLTRDEQKQFKDLIKLLTATDQKEVFVRAFLSQHEDLKKVYKIWSVEFKKIVESKSLYTLSDLETKFLDKIKNKKMNKIWDYCFFDEYQDTNPKQKEIIDIIASDSVKYFVGDPFQSIYYFRGARKEIFDAEIKRVKDTTASIEYKTTNYRSSPQIVKFVNELCSIIFKDFHSMTAHKENPCDDVSVAFFENKDAESEFQYILQQFKTLDINETAILSRNTKSLLACAQYLKEHGVSVNTSFGKNFEESLEVSELISLLKFIHDQTSDFDLINLLKSDWFFIPDNELKVILKKSKSDEVFLWDLVKSDHRVSVLNELVEDFYSYSVVLKDFLLKTEFLNKTDLIDDTGVREFNILKFLKALEDEELKTNFNVMAFCDDVMKGLYPFGKELPDQSQGCQLMTVHGSKGLQFKNVFIIGCNTRYHDGDQIKAFFIHEKEGRVALKLKDEETNENKFPFLIQQQILETKAVKMEENRRLLYVAVTRAEERLFLTGSGKREKTPAEPSWMTQALRTLEKNPGLGHLISEVGEAPPPASQSVKKNSGVFYLNKEPLQRIKKRASASQLEIQDEHLILTNHQDPIKISKAISLGVKFHLYMEGSLIEDEAFDKAAKYLKLQNEFPFEDIYKHGFREWGYDWSPEGNEENQFESDAMAQVRAKESGKVDLWAHLGETVWIVDYKTGSAKNLDKGFMQLERYKTVICDYLNRPSLRFKLVLTFPFQEKTWVKS